MIARALLSSAALIAFLLTAGCDSDGSGGGTVSALALPDRIEISKVDDDTQSSAARARGSPRSTIVGLYSDPDTDYSNQSKETWADDTNALQMVNSILGVIHDTRYQDFVNAGPYKALVRKVEENQSAQSGSAATSSTTEDLMEIVVDVTRASNSDPMIIKIWVKEPSGPGGNAMRIRGYFTVWQGVSDAYPYGVLEAHFKGTVLDSNGNEGDEFFHMVMSVDADSDGNVIVEYSESADEGNWSCINQTKVIANSTMTSGKAYVYQYEGENGSPITETTSYYAFNENYLKKKTGSTTTVYDKNNFTYKVYRYKLFYADTGEAVDLDAGFPIQLPTGEYGYIGYYGLWVPYGVQVQNGATVTRVNTGEEYTLFKVSGKLTKHTKSTIELGDLIGVEMSKYECSDSGCKDYIIIWDGTNFKKIGERNQQTQAVDYYPEQDQEIVTFQPWEGAWCEALRSFLRLGDLTNPTNASLVPYHIEQVVYPGTVQDLTLYYWGYAPDAPITQDELSGVDEQAYWANPTEKVYTFDASSFVLLDSDADPVVIGSDIDLSQTQYPDGFFMSPLTTTQYSADEWWRANEADIYYTWQTGTNDWNQFATVIDSDGNYVTFSSPLRFTYTHHTENDINGESTYDGKVFTLEYDGYELHVPWKYNESRGKWEPLINLKDGTVLTDGTTNYVVKGIAEAVVMQEVSDLSVADDLVIDETIGAPSVVYDPTKTAQVGEVPADAELKVIKGELVQ